MTREPSVADTLQQLRDHAAGRPATLTRAQARRLAVEFERLQAFEQYMRGIGALSNQIQVFLDQFGRVHRDSHDRNPASSQEGSA